MASSSPVAPSRMGWPRKRSCPTRWKSGAQGRCRSRFKPSFGTASGYPLSETRYPVFIPHEQRRGTNRQHRAEAGNSRFYKGFASPGRFPGTPANRGLAETEGFEPSVPDLPVRRFSKPLVSATHPRLRIAAARAAYNGGWEAGQALSCDFSPGLHYPVESGVSAPCGRLACACSVWAQFRLGSSPVHCDGENLWRKKAGQLPWCPVRAMAGCCCHPVSH